MQTIMYNSKLFRGALWGLAWSIIMALAAMTVYALAWTLYRGGL
jgi:hypothetical protein